MIDIKILFISSDRFSETKKDITEKYAKNYNLNFINLSNENLKSEIKNSDIQIVIVNDTIENFTTELYEDVKNEFLSFYFHKIKVKINTSTIKNIKSIKTLKERVSSSDDFQTKEELLHKIDAKLTEQLAKKEKNLKPDIDSTYLEAIKIENYFSIKDMEIDDLKDKKEIYFVGENGDGKTVLLQAILLALKGEEYSGLAELYLGKEKEKMEFSTIDTKYNSDYKKYKNVENIFAYGINRNKINNKLSKEGLGYSALFDTPSVNRTTYLREPEVLLKHESNIVNNFIAKIEDLMGSKLNILKINNEVKFKEVGGETIEFDMLSEGYKSTLIWLCDLLSRLMENQPSIEKLSEYQAIVLVDEIDLYLHPKWRYDFVFKLRLIFPKIQFIMTTHSIVTILGASNDEETAFYKIYKESGKTKVSEQIDSISHYTANILVTSPLFNLDNVKARNYDKTERVSGDDYIYNKIHAKIKERISATNTVNSKEIDDWLNEEFDREFQE
jgi:predicted ATP-binding protein involved in virulence